MYENDQINRNFFLTTLGTSVALAGSGDGTGGDQSTIQYCKALLKGSGDGTGGDKGSGDGTGGDKGSGDGTGGDKGSGDGTGGYKGSGDGTGGDMADIDYAYIQCMKR